MAGQEKIILFKYFSIWMGIAYAAYNGNDHMLIIMACILLLYAVYNGVILLFSRKEN